MAEWRLNELGWRAFQDLCGAIVREILGQTAQTFEDGADVGRDGAFWGRWSELEDQQLEGAFVLQVKHVSSKPTLSLADIADELEKIPGLVGKGLCDVYVLMTNARVTGKSEIAIRAAIEKLGVSEVRVWAGSWIAGQIESSSQLRRLAPRVYGLGDLTSILDERRLQQAQAVLAYLGGSASTFVETSTYYRALDALSERGIVLLLGQPTVGKSVIAQMLTLGAIDAHQAEPVRITRAEEFTAAWNPQEDGRRIYWIDDAFGDLAVQSDLVNGWLRAMPELLAALDRGSRFVFTSRDYIYRAAQESLKESSYPLWRDSSLEVLVASLTDRERARILYTHMKLGDQPKDFKSAIKSHLRGVSRLPSFTPGLAARLGRAAFTASVVPDSLLSVRAFFDQPTEYLREVLRGLRTSDYAALAFLYSHGGRVHLPIPNTKPAQDRLTELGSSLAELGPSLRSMDGTFVRGTSVTGPISYEFWHPTIRQAMASLLQEDAASVRILFEGTETSDLAAAIDLRPAETIPIDELGRFILIGEDLVDPTLDRLAKHEPEVHNANRYYTDLAQLLAQRASKEIRAEFVKVGNVAMQRWLGVGFAYANQNLRLLAKLESEGMLPRSARDIAVRRIRSDAVGLDSTYWIDDPSVETLLGRHELNDLRDEVAEALIDGYSGTVQALQESWESDFWPEGHIEPARTTLQVLEEYFASRPEVIAAIEEGYEELAALQADLEERYSSGPDDDDWKESRDFSSAQSSESPVHITLSRDMFDDVDL